MGAFELQWLLHALHHVFVVVAQYPTHCHFFPAKHAPPPGKPGHHYYIGRFVCWVHGVYGRMYPQH
jgi:hypothetical protein